jgi:hypothetical protein
MTRDQFEDKQHHLSVTAGMNQRYHQNRQFLWTVWNRGIQIVVALLAVVGVCLAVAAFLVENWYVDIWSIAIASCAAGLAVAMNILPFGDWAALHADFLRQWSDLREDVDALQFDLDSTVSDELLERLKKLDAKVHRICGSEPKPNDRLIKRHYNDEVLSRELRDGPIAEQTRTDIVGGALRTMSK